MMEVSEGFTKRDYDELDTALDEVFKDSPPPSPAIGERRKQMF